MVKKQAGLYCMLFVLMRITIAPGQAIAEELYQVGEFGVNLFAKSAAEPLNGLRNQDLVK
jgi:hypothetical protein